MKKNLLLLLALVLIASLTIAAGGNGVKIQGHITAINYTAGTLVVDNSITVQIKPGTKVYEKADDGCVPIAFTDLSIGDRVNVIGQYSGGVLIANKIIVH